MNAIDYSDYIYHNAIAFDQLFNTLTGGYADETFSSRAYRNAKISTFWAKIEKAINTIFFWQKIPSKTHVIRHCELSYLAEYERKHSPKELQ